MAARIGHALALVLLLAAAAPARADDAAMQNVYAAMENDIRREYASVVEEFARGLADRPAEQFEKTREMLKLMHYNKATLFAFCAAAADDSRPADAQRVPAERNIFLTTCFEGKFAELNKFSDVISYAHTFFPGRIEPCGEAARLREREKLLPPYAFLEMTEPKLYDFGRYNECLMSGRPGAVSPSSPAAR